MSNILLNKPATANNFCAPFTPQKAVDGVVSAASRWLCSIKDSTNHAWLQVDLQGNYCVSQYSLAFMGSINGWNTAQYNISGYELQGSNDGGTWFRLDNVSGNTSANINKNLTPTWTRFLRVYISQGLVGNPGVASIVEFQASEPAIVPLLTTLIPSVGTLSPTFNNRNFNYSINVANDAGSIAFTPTAQTNMEIKVNNVVVQSGNQSAQINLAVGNNTIPITVKSPDGQILTTYNVYVTRAGIASSLSALSIIEENLEIPVTLNPAFNSSTLNYTSTVNGDYTSVAVTPTTRDASATIKVNNVIVASGQPSGSITLKVGSNTITIQVIASGGTITTYTVVITKTA